MPTDDQRQLSIRCPLCGSVGTWMHGTDDMDALIICGNPGCLWTGWVPKEQIIVVVHPSENDQEAHNAATHD